MADILCRSLSLNAENLHRYEQGAVAGEGIVAFRSSSFEKTRSS